MYSDRSLKGLKETPMLFGVRGRYIMMMVGALVIETMIAIVGMVVFFFQKKFAIGFFLLAMWFIGLILIFLFFRWVSVVKDFKKIKNRPEIITNKDLIDYL